VFDDFETIECEGCGREFMGDVSLSLRCPLCFAPEDDATESSEVWRVSRRLVVPVPTSTAMDVEFTVSQGFVSGIRRDGYGRMHAI
jgi:hypothetical protein